MTQTPSVVALLDIEPALGRFVGMRAAARIGRDPRLPVIDVPAGAWDPQARPPAVLALAVMSGWLRTARWLLGPSDRFDPWGDDQQWTACSHVRLAVLGGELAELLRPWPTVAADLAARRSHVVELPAPGGDDEQLLNLLWRIAQRWGTIAGQAIVLPVVIDADALAGLSGDSSPDVAGALERLTASGRLTTSADDRGWRLHGGNDLRAQVAYGLASARASRDDFVAAAFRSGPKKQFRRLSG